LRAGGLVANSLVLRLVAGRQVITIVVVSIFAAIAVSLINFRTFAAHFLQQ